jgi:hypothetical protein
LHIGVGRRVIGTVRVVAAPVSGNPDELRVTLVADLKNDRLFTSATAASATAGSVATGAAVAVPGSLPSSPSAVLAGKAGLRELHARMEEYYRYGDEKSDNFFGDCGDAVSGDESDVIVRSKYGTCDDNDGGSERDIHDRVGKDQIRTVPVLNDEAAFSANSPAALFELNSIRSEKTWADRERDRPMSGLSLRFAL